jgi:hypothetical protein
MLQIGKLLRRTASGDELLAEWTASDEASVTSAEAAFRHWLDQDYEAVQSDGVHTSQSAETDCRLRPSR